MNSDPAKQAWQGSVEIAGPPPLAEVRKGADKFYRRIWWRNAIEYAACVVVVLSFTFYVFSEPHILQKIGSVMIVIATLYVAWQLHRRGSAQAPERGGATPIYVFVRAQMVRQRDALRAIFWWYLLPFLPGMAVMMAGNLIVRRAEVGLGPIDAIGVAGMFALFAGVWWLNQRAARKLQRHIDEIDALIGEIE